MIAPDKLQEFYDDGAIVSHLAGLESVWDAAQLEILQGPGHHHRHPQPVSICVPDPCQPALFAITPRHHHHPGDHHVE
jgi:hypothetical protein